MKAKTSRRSCEMIEALEDRRHLSVDLSPAHLTLEKTTTPGYAIATVGINNSGNTASGSFNFRIIYYATGVPATIMADVPVSSIGPTSPEYLNVPVAVNFPPETLTLDLRVEIDAYNTVAETNESNNVLVKSGSQAVETATYYPDLVVSAASVAKGPASGEVNITYTVKNEGRSIAPLTYTQSSTTYQLPDVIEIVDQSNNVVLDQYGVPLRRAYWTNSAGVMQLASNQSLTKTVTFPGLPASTSPLRCRILTNAGTSFYVPGAFVFDEVNVSGNAASNNDRSVYGLEDSQYFADLVVLQRPALQVTGTSATVNWSVRNEGGVAARMSTLVNGASVYASDTVTLYNADTGETLRDANNVPLVAHVRTNQGTSVSLLSVSGTIAKSYTFSGVPAGVPVAVRVETNTGQTLPSQSTGSTVQEKNTAGLPLANNVGRDGDLVAIAVTRAQFVPGSSTANSIAISFDQLPGTSLIAGDLYLKNESTGQVIAASAISVSTTDGGKTAIFQFPGLTGGQLPSGRYLARIDAGKVADPSGNALAVDYVFNFIWVTAGGTLSLPAGVTKVNQVSLASTAKLDVGASSLIIDYAAAGLPPSTGGTMLGEIGGLITSGYNNGDWAGYGITSSAAANDPTFLTALGYANNAELNASSLSGTALTGQEILIKYTYFADADLNGYVDGDDFNLFLAGYQDPANVPQTWIYGNFDYLGGVDLDDFNLHVAAEQGQGPPL